MANLVDDENSLCEDVEVFAEPGTSWDIICHVSQLSLQKGILRNKKHENRFPKHKFQFQFFYLTRFNYNTKGAFSLPPPKFFFQEAVFWATQTVMSWDSFPMKQMHRFQASVNTFVKQPELHKQRLLWDIAGSIGWLNTQFIIYQIGFIWNMTVLLFIVLITAIWDRAHKLPKLIDFKQQAFRNFTWVIISILLFTSPRSARYPIPHVAPRCYIHQ